MSGNAIFFAAPQSVVLDSNRQALVAGTTINASGASLVFTGIGLNNEITVTLNVVGSVSGTNPSLTLNVQELDPGDQVTVLNTVSAVALTAAGNRTVKLVLTRSDCVKVTWTVSGTTPSFGLSYITLVCGGVTALPDVVVTQSLAATNAAIVIPMAGRMSVGMQVTAASSPNMTILPEASIDGGTTWVAVYFDQIGGTRTSSQANPPNTTTRSITPPGGASHVRVRASAYTSGSITVMLRATMVPGATWTDVMASTATPANVAASASVVTLLAANDKRLYYEVHNDSTTAILYLKNGSGATTSSFSAKILPGGSYYLPVRYPGIVTGIWSAASGAARITEYAA